MSFDIFVQRFRDKEPATFKRSDFEDIFGAYVIRRESDPGFVEVKFPDGSVADVYVSEQENVDSIMFNHCGGEAFFQALYQLADRIKGCIYWPDLGPSSVVTDATTPVHLSPDFAEALGPPIVVTNGVGILEAIQRS